MRIILFVSILAIAACGSTSDGSDAPPSGADARADAGPGTPDAPTPDAGTPDSSVLPDADPACVSCSEAIQTGAQPDCPGSAALLEAIATCACAGACAADCGDNICVGADPSPACQTCLFDTAAGCGNEVNACLADT